MVRFRKVIRKCLNTLMMWLGLKRKPLISGLCIMVPRNYDEMLRKYPTLVDEFCIDDSYYKHFGEGTDLKQHITEKES